MAKPRRPSKPRTTKPRTTTRKTTTRKPATKPRTIRAPKKPERKFRVVPLKANVVEQLPETPLSRKGLTLRQLLRNTPKFRKDTGKYEVVITGVKKKKTASGLPALTAKAKHPEAYMPGKTVRNREVYIIGLDDQNKPVNKQRRVMVSCDCEDFVFHGGEYACALHGAARIIYGNGEPPKFTNPGNVPFLCKHLSALAYESIEKNL